MADEKVADTAAPSTFNPEAEGWEQKGGTLVKLEGAGEYVVGTLTGKRLITVTGPNGTNEIGQYTIHTKDGNILLNGASDLDAKLADVDPPVDVRIVFTGTVRTAGGRNVRKFDVFTRATRA